MSLKSRGFGVIVTISIRRALFRWFVVFFKSWPSIVDIKKNFEKSILVNRRYLPIGTEFSATQWRKVVENQQSFNLSYWPCQYEAGKNRLEIPKKFYARQSVLPPMSNPLRKSLAPDQTETTLHIQLFTLIPNPATIWPREWRRMEKRWRSGENFVEL